MNYQEKQKRLQEIRETVKISDYIDDTVTYKIKPKPITKPVGVKLFDLRQEGVYLAGNRYYDTTSAIQVIGCVYKQPSLLEDEGTYFFTEEDFTNDLHKVVFGLIGELHL